MSEEIIIDPEPVEVAPSSSRKVIEGKYRKSELLLPRAAEECKGISLFGRVIRTLVFSTDIAIIRNCDADAVLAVYPFTCQPAITQALLTYAERPVFTGVAGAVTTGPRSIELAVQSEMQGAMGVVANTSTRPNVIKSIARSVDIPVVVSIVDLSDYALEQIGSGAQIVNVAAGRKTPEVVRQLRGMYPTLPIIASGGKTDESIRSTIDAGADAISWTPPSMQELEKISMEKNARVRKNAAEIAKSSVERDALLFEAVSRAANGLINMDEERREELYRENVGEVDAWFTERLGIDDKKRLRQLLLKLFNITGDNSQADMQVSQADEGIDSDLGHEE